jgi:hypothetical protein
MIWYILPNYKTFIVYAYKLIIIEQYNLITNLTNSILHHENKNYIC